MFVPIAALDTPPCARHVARENRKRIQRNYRDGPKLGHAADNRQNQRCPLSERAVIRWAAPHTNIPVPHDQRVRGTQIDFLEDFSASKFTPRYAADTRGGPKTS
jgi:hypothetical protein